MTRIINKTFNNLSLDMEVSAEDGLAGVLSFEISGFVSDFTAISGVSGGPCVVGVSTSTDVIFNLNAELYYITKLSLVKDLKIQF